MRCTESSCSPAPLNARASANLSHLIQETLGVAAVVYQQVRSLHSLRQLQVGVETPLAVAAGMRPDAVVEVELVAAAEVRLAVVEAAPAGS